MTLCRYGSASNSPLKVSNMFIAETMPGRLLNRSLPTKLGKCYARLVAIFRLPFGPRQTYLK